MMARRLTNLADIQAKLWALKSPKNLKPLRKRGKWTKKDTYFMFYGEFAKFGAFWVVFLMLKNLLVGMMLTTCEVSMCAVPCPCGMPAEYRVSAPLLNVSGKVWTIALMYVAEFCGYIFFNPDTDVFNGWKLAFMQMQQSLIMLVAALMATDYISETAGAAALITVATLQVSMAMPEQIFGVIKAQVLGPKGAPGFPMKVSEFELKKELACGFEKKVEKAQGLMAKVNDMKPHMSSGDVCKVFSCLLLDKELLQTFNVLSPGCLNEMFESLFNMDPVADGLEMIKENMSILESPIDKLMEIEWERYVEISGRGEVEWDVCVWK